MKQFFKDAKGHLMTGIGYMLPLIIGASRPWRNTAAICPFFHP